MPMMGVVVVLPTHGEPSVVRRPMIEARSMMEPVVTVHVMASGISRRSATRATVAIGASRASRRAALGTAAAIARTHRLVAIATCGRLAVATLVTILFVIAATVSWRRGRTTI